MTGIEGSRIEERFLPQNFQCGKNPASSQTPVATTGLQLMLGFSHTGNSVIEIFLLFY